MGTRKDNPKCTEEYVRNVQNQLSKTIKPAYFRVVSCLYPSTIRKLREEIIAIVEELKLVGTAVPRNFKNVQTQLNEIRWQHPLISMGALIDIFAKVTIMQPHFGE
mgnify:CR=1 FL=1